MGEKKRFLDRVLRFMGIEEEEIAASAELEAGQPTSLDMTFDGAAQNLEPLRLDPIASDGGDRAYVPAIKLRPLDFDDVQVIADRLIARTPVLMDVEHLDIATARRILDFLSGTTYAMAGYIQPVGQGMFLLTPGGVEVDPSSLPSEAKEDFTFKKFS